MKSLSGGIDIGSESHHVIIMDDTGEVLYDRKVAHQFSEFHKVIGEFKGIEEREQGVIAFAIEGKNGYGAPFDRILIENGFKLYNVDNLKLRRFRDVFGSEWRNDRRDAKMLAKMLRLKDHMDAQEEKAFIAVEKPSAVHEKLRILSRHQQSLIDEKVRIQSRLRKRLLEVCPDILEHGDTNSKKLLQLLKKYPDFSRYKKITLGALLKIETIGKKTAVSILEGLRNIQYVEELTGIYKALISSYCHRILELKEEIKMLDRELEEAGQKSAEVMQLKSIKGVGTKLSSRLAGEIGDIRRFNRESQLAVYCGVACIDDDSGKSKRTKAVYKANRICKATMIEIAGCTIRYVQESKTYYEKKRAEGKKHNHALRCLARQLIKVIFKMLTENREYIYKEELKKAA
ncbi:MAG: transposase IS116/IS110/IS902 family protein [Candidatus Dadabacteria bacterium CSP1-2]|nr:MAG: transposase IS116/IS110/IS902 family protein [Candidatus Dadabacteria bacterium CSP1-2]